MKTKRTPLRSSPAKGEAVLKKNARKMALTAMICQRAGAVPGSGLKRSPKPRHRQVPNHQGGCPSRKPVVPIAAA